MTRDDLIRDIQSRPKNEISCNRILVAIDGSQQTFKAVNEAIQFSVITNAELTILMVVDYDKNVSAFEQVTLSGYVPAELKVAAYKFLAELMHVIPSEIKAHTRVETGHPGEIILAVAEEEASDLIIMGTRGLGAVHSLLAGSVSNHVVQYAKCPVLLCKGITNDFENVEI